jgi:hypothetical protein
MVLWHRGGCSRPYLARVLVDAGNVDFRGELDGRRVIGIVGTAMNVGTVYPVLMDALIETPVSIYPILNTPSQ